MEICDEKNNIFTIDVIHYLFRNYPDKKFIWLMGVDNLKKISSLFRLEENFL